MSIDRQVAWIHQIFIQCISRLHPKGGIFAELIGEFLADLYRSPALSLPDACRLYEAMYGLFWCGAQSLLDMRGFDVHAVGPFRAYLASHGAPVRPREHCISDPNRGLRIAYFCHYAYESRGNALAPIVSALALNHARTGNREIFIYCVQWSAQDFIDGFNGTGVTVRNFPNRADYGQLEKLVESIRADKIDVVISEVASSIATYVFSRRVASLQIWLEPGYPFWSTPDLDWVLLGGKQWQPWFGVPRERHSGLRIRLPLAHQNIDPASEDQFAAKSRIPAGVKIFAVFVRLIKITPSYLALAKRFLLQAPAAHLLIAGTGDSRLVKAFKGDDALRGRVTFINENVDLNVYGRLIDVFLDTFPFVGGLACRDVACHGKPIVSMLAGEWDILLREERIPSLLAGDAEEYLSIATRLVLDDDFYAECAQATKLLSARHVDPGEMIIDVEHGISRASRLL